MQLKDYNNWETVSLLKVEQWAINFYKICSVLKPSSKKTTLKRNIINVQYR